MTLRSFLAAVAALLCLAPAQAQMLRVPGEPVLTPKAAPEARLRLEPARAKAAHSRLPPVSAAEVAAVRRANARPHSKPRAGEMLQRVVVGVPRAAEAPRDLPDAEALAWRAVEGGHAARLAVTSPEAGSLRLALDLAGVPTDVELVVFGSGNARLEGPVRVAEIPDRTAWWTPLTEGETQTVEVFVPARHDPAALDLRVADVAHLFSTPSSGFTKRTQDIGDAGTCNVDLPCTPLHATAAFQSIARSVAQMVFIDDGFATLCTGTLLADGNAATQAPWFYSANHCFENPEAPYKTPAQMQAVANTLSTLWGFESTACGSAVLSASYLQLGGGATLIHNNPQSDVLFLRLNAAPPPTAFFSGWDATPLANGQGVVTVHHPMGDLKKASQGTFTGFEAPGVGGGAQSFARVSWSVGTTEIGSSGGGLWTLSGGQYFLRGGLFGGFAGCDNLTGADYFSRFDQAYGALSPYLGTAVGPALNYSDLWWNPNESGWGLNLIQHATNTVFGVWYTYAGDGKRTWFTIPSGTWTSRTTYTGPLYTTAGPPFNAEFIPGNVQARQVGTATLTFSGPDTGTFTYSVDGVSGSKSITRQPF